ncbi:MAG: methylmalonyl Co-A mutase-associated GTPase MeaB [Chloroflexota bacterium]
MDRLTAGVLRGDRRALARLMTMAERYPGGVGAAITALHDRLGRALVIGVTGPPGGGKSTLLLRLAQVYRARHQSVGLVAVDPSSPMSGGSVLGDRIRMQELHADPAVFIRSMASGGLAGGLAAGTLDMVDLLDAFGFDVIFIESVGVGQGETDISRVVDTNVVVVVPGLGDDIQALKAGVLETGDIFVVNKSDRPEARATAATLRAMLELGEQVGWTPQVLATSALKADGIEALVDAIGHHAQFLKESGQLVERRTGRAMERIRLIVTQRFMCALQNELQSEISQQSVRALMERVGEADAVVQEVLDRATHRLSAGVHTSPGF